MERCEGASFFPMHLLSHLPFVELPKRGEELSHFFFITITLVYQRVFLGLVFLRATKIEKKKLHPRPSDFQCDILVIELISH